MSGSYGDHEFKHFHSGQNDGGRPTATILEVGTGNLDVWTMQTPMVVKRIMVEVTVAFDYDTLVTEGVVTFFRRITYGSDVGRVAIGTIRLINGTAAGRILYREINDVNLAVGEQIVSAVTTAAVGGTELGDFLTAFAGDYRPETVANQTNYVLAT